MSPAYGWQDQGNGMARAIGAVPTCPVCGHQLDGLASTDQDEVDVQPSPGCGTVCLGCTTILQFDAELQLGLMTAERWADLQPPDRALTEKMSVVAGMTMPLSEPIVVIAWHVTGWYAVTIFPDGLHRDRNVVVRSRPYATRQELDRIADRGNLQTLVIVMVGQDMLSGRWGWQAVIESVTLGWRHAVDQSGPIYATQAEANQRSDAVADMVRTRYGIQVGRSVYRHDQKPKGQLS